MGHSAELQTLVEGGRSTDAAERISGALDAIDSDLAWQLGLSEEGRLALTISAEGDPRLRKTVDSLFQHCPSIPGWDFYPYKQPKSSSTVTQLLHSQGYQIDLAKITVDAELTPSRERVNLLLRSPDFGNIPPKNATTVAFFILDGLLGEEMLEHRIGAVEVEPVYRSNGIPLLRLPDFMKELVHGRT